MQYKTEEGPLLTDRPAEPAPVASPRAVVTYTLIAINVLVFAVMVLSGVSATNPSGLDLLRWGADFGPQTLHGEPWRLFTAIFLHFGIIHLGLNMYVFYQMGGDIEAIFGRVRYLVLYVMTGLAGNLLSLYVHPYSVGAGASGAIFGVYGGFLGFLFIRRKVIPGPVMQQMMRSSAMFLGINLVYGFARAGIDMSAHIGGLVSGFLLGCYFTERPDNSGLSG